MEADQGTRGMNIGYRALNIDATGQQRNENENENENMDMDVMETRMM